MVKATVGYDKAGKLQVLGMPLAALAGPQAAIADMPAAIVTAMNNRGIKNLQVKVDNEGVTLMESGQLWLQVRLGSQAAIDTLNKLSAAFGMPMGDTLNLAGLRDRVELDFTVNLQ